MKVPNWQHHSKKEQKRHLKPQALRQARKRRNPLKKCLLNPSQRRVFDYYGHIETRNNGSTTRNQITTC